MSLGKVARKLKRVGKTAYQFRFTSTFEYIQLNCNGTWRPDNLRVIWIRSHRRVQSINIKWEPTEDRGPNGAVGKATFDPSFAVALIVTIYGDPNGKGNFEDKEYKYYIESDGPTGKKIVASFNIDVAEYATMAGSKHTLDMSFKPVSKKINKAILGITLQSEFMKQGNAVDDDMQSTFSAVSGGQDSLQFDEEDEDLQVISPLDQSDASVEKGLPKASGDTELVTLGTGERMKRTTLPRSPPRKPQRHITPNASPMNTPEMSRKQEGGGGETGSEAVPESGTGTQTEGDVEEEPEHPSMYMNLTAEGEVDSMEGELEEPLWEGDEEEGEQEVRGKGKAREEARDRRASRRQKRERVKSEREREKQERKQKEQEEKEEKRERRTREKSKSKSPGPEESMKEKSPPLPERNTTTVVDDGQEDEEDASASRASEVVVVEPPGEVTACGQVINVIFDTSDAGEGTLTATCKGTKVEGVETRVMEETAGKYRVQFTPDVGDVYMLSVHWGGKHVPGSPFLINLNLLPPARKVEKEKEGGEVKDGGGGSSEGEKVAEKLKENGIGGGEGEEVKGKVDVEQEVKGKVDAKQEVKGKVDVEQEMKGKVDAKQEVKRKTDVEQEVKKKGKSKPEVKEKEEVKLGVREKSPEIIISEDPFDVAYKASRILEEQQREAQGGHLDDAESPEKSGRKTVVSKEEWTPPSNHLYEDMPGEDELEEEEPPPSPLEAWLGDAHFTDCFGESVSREKLENADIIGLYFSANWCPPCRRFLPKLVKFYHHLKQNQKSFELLYISSDYSKQEMMKYMQEQQMPWVALAFDSTISDKLRVDYNVSAIPILTIVSKEGIKLEERARKPVEQATSSSAVLKLYNKWVERSQHSAEGEGGEGEKKVGLLKTIKSAIHKQGKDQTFQLTGPGSATSTLESQKSQGGEASDIEASGGASARVTVEPRSRSRTKQKLKESSSVVSISAQEMEEKEEKVRHLEEVNMSLKQTNDDLNEEVAELKRQIGEFQAKMTTLEQSSRQLEDEKRELMANLNIRGWLVKRGVKGPTANVWRRRYFRCDQGSKIYYYKSSSEGTPQGYIDLDHVVSVQEVSAAQQDKNHATFLVQCEGRTFQLQAHDETTMRKWMSAIEYLQNWRQKNSSSGGP